MEIEVRRIRESFFKFLGRDKASRNQEIELKEGVALVAKKKNDKGIELFFGDPNPTVVVESLYESDKGQFCKTTDYSSKFKDGEKHQIHSASFLKKNFQPSPVSFKK